MQIMQHLSSHIHYLTPYQETDRPILVAITGTKSTLLVDAGNSSAHIQFFIDQLVKFDISPRCLVLTHWHWDHVFGMNQANTTIIAQTMTTERIKEMQGWTWDDAALDERVADGREIPFCADAIKKELGEDREILLPTPDITFERRLEINLGRVNCIVEHVGGDHSADSSVIYIEEDQVLILGDAIYPNIHVTPNEYTSEGALKLVQSLRQFDAEIVVLSHHSEPWDRERFNHELDLLEQTARLTENTDNDEAIIQTQLKKYFARELTEYEIETVELFINGRNRQQIKS